MYFFGSYVDYIVQNRKRESSIKKDKMSNETEKGGRALQTPIKTNEDIALSPPIETASTPQRERNAGIDLLKTLAMFMVVVLHVLGQGGVLGAAQYPNPSHAMGWWLEIESFGAVNCFAIATGFLMVGRKIKYRKLLSLWLTVQFYNLLFYLLYLVHPIEGVTLLDVSNFFPVYSGEFWYFTAYFGLFLFIPFLIKYSSKQTVGAFSIIRAFTSLELSKISPTAIRFPVFVFTNRCANTAPKTEANKNGFTPKSSNLEIALLLSFVCKVAKTK